VGSGVGSALPPRAAALVSSGVVSGVATPLVLRPMPAAFVTGGSGFVGGRLTERLVRDGWDVAALARSPAAEARVQGLGARSVHGDLGDHHALAAGARGADACFHAAAHVKDFGPWETFRRINVEGTRNIMRACRDAGVPRFVHVGTEAVLLKGQPLVHADETYPLAFDSPAPYSRSKARAEQVVLEEGRDGLEAVVVRPRFVWGRGDTTLLPVLVEGTRTGRFRWVGGGRHLTSTTHIDNTVEGLVLAAENGRPGGVYFVTDGAPVVFREFVSELIASQGVEPPTGNVPAPLARALAVAGEAAWRLLPLRGAPPLTRFASWIASCECTLDDTRAREELGYRPIVSREQGLAELRAGRVG
jgi:nucleoside-diphosphate-sugar epimerase